jgi:hypothetical protein
MDIREFKEKVFKKELKTLFSEKERELLDAGCKPTKTKIARAISIDIGIKDYMSLYRAIYGNKLG